MCGIAGLVNLKQNLLVYKNYNTLLVRDMADGLCSGAPGTEWVGEHAAFAGAAPFSRIIEGYEFVITYTGTLYNAPRLRSALSSFGYSFPLQTDAETALLAYVHYGTECAALLEGAYAFCIWDSMRQRAFACRDRLGLQPLFYALRDDSVLFASKPAALFRHPAVTPAIGREELQMLLACPAQADCVFCGMEPLPAAHHLCISRAGLCSKRYWALEASCASAEEAAAYITPLLQASIAQQPSAAAWPATALGGAWLPPVSGSACDALFSDAADPLQTLQDAVTTNNRPYPLDGAAMLLASNFGAIKKRHAALFSDCGAALLEAPLSNLEQPPFIPPDLLLPAVAETLQLAEFARAQQAAACTLYQAEETAEQPDLKAAEISLRQAAQQAAHLECTAAAYGPALRFPFLDHRLAEYAWALPPAQKAALCELLLQKAAPGSTPAAEQHLRLNRYLPQYQSVLKQALHAILEAPGAPLLAFFDRQALCKLHSTSSADTLQLLGYLFQLNAWLERYRPSLL